MAMRVANIFFFVFLCGTACEEAIDRPPDSANTDLLVVEAVLTNERIRHLVKLTKPYQSQNIIPAPASGAVVTLDDGNQSATLVEFPSGSGHYYTPEFRAVTGVTYTLSISYEGRNFVAHDRAVPVDPLEPLGFRKSGDGYMLTAQPSGQDPYYINHTLTWKHTSACANGSDCTGKVVFYDLKTIDVNEIFKPEKEDFVFPQNTIVIRKKFSVSDGYRTFLRSMLSETEWRGGVFDVQRANVPTNLSAGAVGFFAVSTVVSDTTVVR
jgi:hypothetical protein